MQFWFYARQRNGRRIVRYGRMKEYIEVGENIVYVFVNVEEADFQER